MALPGMDRAAFWRRVAEGRHRDHLPLHLWGPAEARETLEAAAARLTLAAKLADESAAETAATLMAIFKRLAPELKNSITVDEPRQKASGSNPERTAVSRPRRGSERARHGLLASVSGMTLRRPQFATSGQLAEGQRREHQRPAAKAAAEAPRPRHPEPGRPPGDRAFPQPHATEVPRLSHADPVLLQRPRQG